MLVGWRRGDDSTRAPGILRDWTLISGLAEENGAPQPEVIDIATRNPTTLEWPYFPESLTILIYRTINFWPHNS